MVRQIAEERAVPGMFEEKKIYIQHMYLIKRFLFLEVAKTLHVLRVLQH